MDRASFQAQDCEESLAEGLARYHAANSDLLDRRGMDAEAAEFFRCHDVAHVVFGCGTSLDDEMVVKIASMFGTTAGFGVLRGYRLHESMQIYRRLPATAVLASIARAPILVPRTIARCRRQSARWPWSDHDGYLAVPLREIREKYGILVAHGGSTMRQ